MPLLSVLVTESQALKLFSEGIVVFSLLLVYFILFYFLLFKNC